MATPKKTPAKSTPKTTSTSREDSERIATWVSADFLHAVRVYSAVTGQSMRQLIEESVSQYMAEHPLSDTELRKALDPKASKK